MSGAFSLLSSPAGALSESECEALVEEGRQARDDLATLLEAVSDGSTGTTSEDTGSYVADLLTSAAINEFGFVSADAGAPLELCVPEGTTRLTMFSDPIVLWEGLATSKASPISVVIPAGVSCGLHELAATGNGVDQRVSFEVKGACVAAGSASPSIAGIPLPRTGAEIGRTVAVALGLVAVGTVVVRGRRQQRVER